MTALSNCFDSTWESRTNHESISRSRYEISCCGFDARSGTQTGSAVVRAPARTDILKVWSPGFAVTRPLWQCNGISAVNKPSGESLELGQWEIRTVVCICRRTVIYDRKRKRPRSLRPQDRGLHQ